MDWTNPPGGFTYILFHKTNAVANEYRYYYLAWLDTLTGPAIVRIYGRRGGSQTMRITPFASLERAWPTIRRHIRARLRHGATPSPGRQNTNQTSP